MRPVGGGVNRNPKKKNFAFLGVNFPKSKKIIAKKKNSTFLGVTPQKVKFFLKIFSTFLGVISPKSGKKFKKFPPLFRGLIFAKIYRPTPTNFGEFLAIRFSAEFAAKKADFEATFPTCKNWGKWPRNRPFWPRIPRKKRVTENSPNL